MPCGVLAFVFLFVLPMAAIIVDLAPAAQFYVAWTTGLVILAVVAALQLPRLRRRLRFRRVRRPVPGRLERLDWPTDLTYAELEAHCVAWLRARGWEVTLSTDPHPDFEAVYIMAVRGATRVGLMCDVATENLNPAIIRALAKDSAALGATQAVLVTQSAGPPPQPADVAARQAGVQLLRVADLAQVDALAPAATEAAAVAG